LTSATIITFPPLPPSPPSASLGDELFAAEGKRTRSAVAGFDVDFGFVDEHWRSLYLTYPFCRTGYWRGFPFATSRVLDISICSRETFRISANALLQEYLRMSNSAESRAVSQRAAGRR